MEQAPPARGHSVRRVIRYLVPAAFADLALLLVVVFVHAETSDASLLWPAGLLGAALLALAVSSLLAGVGWAWLTHPEHHRAIAFVVGVTIVTLVAHAALLGTPASGYIGDESYYVPEAQGILAGQQCSFGAGAPANCHMEHPFLVPALMAAGMAVFGPQNSVGWRLMPSVLGTFSIPLLFGVAWKISGSKKLAYLSSLLLALDVMFFTQSGAGFLDVPEVFFGLAAFFAYFAGIRWWKFDRYFIAGVLLGLAGLSKETGVFIVGAFLTYVLLFGEESRGYRVYRSLKVVLVVGLVFAAGLQAYDTTLASASAPTFVQQVDYILSYGSGLIAQRLQCQPQIGNIGAGYFCKYPALPGGPPILPTDWLVYYSPVAYYLVSVTVNPGDVRFVGYAYYGVTNFLETWTVFVWLPLLGYALYDYYRGRQASLDRYLASRPEAGSAPPGEVRFASFGFVLFLWSYLPYLFLFVAGRVTYPFYIIPGIPAMAMGAAYWLSRGWFPKWLLYVYLATVFLFFFVYFPDKSFLPDWLRAFIGH